MTKRQALLRPKSDPLSRSTPTKKSTRGPSPRRLTEAEVSARLAEMGWKIISDFTVRSAVCHEASLRFAIKRLNAEKFLLRQKTILSCV